MKYSKTFQKFAVCLITLSYKFTYRIKIKGKENIPKGGCLVCANHHGLNDVLFLMLSIGPKHEFSGMGKKELYEHKFLGPLLTLLGSFPVNREGNDLKAIKLSLKALKDGKKLIIFPEGTRTKSSGKKAKAGIGLISAKSGCDILPVYIDNAPKLFSKVSITILPVIKCANREDDMLDYSQNVLDTIFAQEVK